MRRCSGLLKALPTFVVVSDFLALTIGMLTSTVGLNQFSISFPISGHEFPDGGNRFLFQRLPFSLYGCFWPKAP